MVSRENSKELPPFWEQRSDLYYNTITNFSEKDRPENVHGGILADDMGLVIIFFLELITFYFVTKILYEVTLKYIAMGICWCQFGTRYHCECRT